MAKFQGVIGTQVAVTGNTFINIDDRIFKAGTRTMWDGACFGISVTQIGTAAFTCTVVGELAGISVTIANTTAIGGTVTRIIPIIPTDGISGASGMVNWMRVPTPRKIFFGNSAIVGQTYAAVVSAMLWGT